MFLNTKLQLNVPRSSQPNLHSAMAHRAKMSSPPGTCASVPCMACNPYGLLVKVARGVETTLDNVICWIGYVFVFRNCQCVGKFAWPVSRPGQNDRVIWVMGLGTKTLRFPTFSTVSIDTFKYVLQNWFYFGQQEQLQVMQKNTFTNNRCFMKQPCTHQHWPLTPFFTLEPPCHALQAPVVMVVAKIPHCIPWVNIWGNGAKKMTVNNLGEQWLIQTEAVARMWDVFSFIFNEYGVFLFGVLHVGIPIKVKKKKQSLHEAYPIKNTRTTMLFALGHGIKGVDHLVLLSVGQPRAAGTAGTAEAAY